jgi:hypothetical protein
VTQRIDAGGVTWSAAGVPTAVDDLATALRG